MRLIEISDKKRYNEFIASQKQAQFLQSWEWGEFNKGLGAGVKRLGLEKDDELVGAMTLIEKKLPLGIKYWYAPRVNFQFPLRFGGQLIFNFQLFCEKLKSMAKNNGIMFLRFDPIEKLSKINYQKSIVKTIDVQPSKTLILDISKSEEDLLKNLHQKTRYNIRLAEKKGIEISEAGEEDFEKWWKIMQETCQRDGFSLHAKNYYKNQLKIRSEKLKIKLIVAKYKGKIIAGNIVAFFGDMATYVHGASSNEFRNLMAPYALQWRAIREAKKYDCKYYDFYGIDEKKWPGVTRFKKGFNGEEIKYPGTFDLIFSRLWYNVYRSIRKLRRMV